MRKLAVPLFSLCLLAAPVWAQSSDAPASAAVPDTAQAAQAETVAPETIRVVAQLPGPGLWKVAKGEHVLWVLGTYSPLPKNMEWRSRQVETVVAQSQEYLAPPGAQAKPGFFKYVTLLPSLIGIRKNPDGARLRDVLAPGDYARWSSLKTRYLPDNDDVERERPIFAAEVLTRAARQQAGLADDSMVRKQVIDLIEKNKLKQTSSVHELPMTNARAVIKNFKAGTLGDAGCLAQTMATLESDIAAASQRANAWAKGDLDEMRKLDFASRKEACFSALMSSAAFDAEPEFRNMMAHAQAKWVASAEKALESNPSTFAMLPMDQILDAKGVIATLAAKGYTVEQPE